MELKQREEIYRTIRILEERLDYEVSRYTPRGLLEKMSDKKLQKRLATRQRQVKEFYGLLGT